ARRGDDGGCGDRIDHEHGPPRKDGDGERTAYAPRTLPGPGAGGAVPPRLMPRADGCDAGPPLVPQLSRAGPGGLYWARARERVVGGSSRGSRARAGSMPMAASVRGRRPRRDQARDGITGRPAVTSSTCTGDAVPMVPEALGPPPSASGPTSTPGAGGRRMDED